MRGFGLVLASGLTALGVTPADAQYCGPQVSLRGPSTPVRSLAGALRAQGVRASTGLWEDEDTAVAVEGCPTGVVAVAERGGRLRIEVTHPSGELKSREVELVGVAASLIHSWLTEGDPESVFFPSTWTLSATLDLGAKNVRPTMIGGASVAMSYRLGGPGRLFGRARVSGGGAYAAVLGFGPSAELRYETASELFIDLTAGVGAFGALPDVEIGVALGVGTRATLGLTDAIAPIVELRGALEVPFSARATVELALTGQFSADLEEDQFASIFVSLGVGWGLP